MEIVFHLGAHCTDRDHVVRCLTRNRQELAQQRIAVPGPSSYRAQLRQLAHEMQGQPTNADTQEALLDALIEEDDPVRVVFSNENQLALPQWAVANSRLYPSAGDRVAQIAHLFPQADLTFALAMRDPATLLPALHAITGPEGKAGELLNSDPMALRWSDMIARMHAAVPHARFIVWRDEDVPLIWPEILRAIAGHDPQTELVGWFAWYWELMTPKTHESMRRYFAKNKITDDLHRRKVLAAMLERFTQPEALEIDPLVPGWSEATLDALSTLYDSDLDLVATLPGVTLLEP